MTTCGSEPIATDYLRPSKATLRKNFHELASGNRDFMQRLLGKKGAVSSGVKDEVALLRCNTSDNLFGAQRKAPFGNKQTVVSLKQGTIKFIKKGT
uniref:Uncharacterized protein n=1 Tax=Romanomermis culicivorax TaxID=13658 RepID=A0A915IYH5_ROMCU